jgi:low temperature requirement protein LtrA
VLLQRAEGIGVEVAETAEDAGAVEWWGTWTLTLMVLALIGIAVGDELAIAHPGDDATLGFTILTFGGPALFLLAQVFFLREALGPVPRSRPLGLAALAILAVATAPLTLIVGIAASTAVLVALGDRRHGPRGRSGAEQVGVAAPDEQAVVGPELARAAARC